MLTVILTSGTCMFRNTYESVFKWTDGEKYQNRTIDLSENLESLVFQFYRALLQKHISILHM